MKPPASVLIGPHRYRVVVDDDGLLGDAGRCGHAARARLVIGLDGEQAPSALADTLVHEIGHALLVTAGLSETAEERVCLALGPGLLQVVRDNADLVRFLRTVST